MNSLDQARHAIKSGNPREALKILDSFTHADECETVASQQSLTAQILRSQAAMLVPDIDLAFAALTAVFRRVLINGVNVLPPPAIIIPSFLSTQQKTQRAYEILNTFHQTRLPAFPFFGSLLGIVRDGQLIEGDKDIDIGVWLDYFELTKVRMLEAGFRPVTGSPPFSNFAGFVCPHTHLVVDVMGLRREPEHSRIVSGFWLYGQPAEWQRVSHFAWFDLIERETTQGPIYVPDHAEQILDSLYGHWQAPDSQWDSLIQAENLACVTTQYRCYAYFRVLEVLRRNQLARALYLTEAACKRMPDDKVMAALRDKLKFSHGQ